MSGPPNTGPGAPAVDVIAFAYEACSFDPRLMRSGTASLVWNSALSLARAGHRVSIVTPAHGQADYLRQRYGARETGHAGTHTLPLSLDPAVWPGFQDSPGPRLTTRALHVRKDDVDLYFLSDPYLDAYPDTFYPVAADEGRRLEFCKPLAFQLAGIRFIRARFPDRPAVIHAHEPLFHYLVPAAFTDDPHKRVVSAVATNHPVNTGVYRPQVGAALRSLGVDLDLHQYSDPPEDEGVLENAMRAHLAGTGLDRPPRHDQQISFFSLVGDHADGIDFLCEGQRTFYTGFEDTPFTPRYRRLTVARVTARNAHKAFVGGCAVSDTWLARDERAVDREGVLSGLGLDPGLPVFYHAARYDIHHKGQLELVRAVEHLLRAGRRASFLLRCATASEIDPYFQEVADTYPGYVHLAWDMADQDTLFEQASVADYCVFPSKYELDTFLIAQGEAMACGAVPIATAQYGTRHFGHAYDVRVPGATGFAVDRSFQEDDALLTLALVDRFHRAVDLFTDEPAEYERLSGNARRTARRLTWERSAAQRSAHFRSLIAPHTAPPPRPAVPPRRPQAALAVRAVMGVHTDAWSISLESADARRVTAFVPERGTGTVPRAHDLRPTRGGFAGTYPGVPPAGGVALLITLSRGRSQWEVVAPAGSATA
ncbi:glycogen/starch synthase [Streptomyces sp. NPDC017230]|uniref:glycogen/starch synthase n=1 Tax=unclassified Streptomyces TaxID=2593676 RepID=UPI00379FF26F